MKSELLREPVKKKNVENSTLGLPAPPPYDRKCGKFSKKKN